MKQDIADRLEILEGQRAEAKQLRKQAEERTGTTKQSY